MIKSKTEQPESVTIDLTGPQGNAFYLIGAANKWCKQGLAKNFTAEQHGMLTAEMKSGDYDHLVKVFDENFGDFCTLYR